MAKAACLVAGVMLCAGVASATLTFPWPFEKLAEAPVIATCVVESTTRESVQPNRNAVPGHAVLRVLRSFPASTLQADERIHLDYDAPAENGMPGDAIALHIGDVVAFPLKQRVEGAAWRMFADQGMYRVIPAIRAAPPFPRAQDGRNFLLHEIASVPLGGTRHDLMAVSGYVQEQNSITPDLLKLLEPRLPAGEERWATVAASLLGSFGIPRPTVAELWAGTVPDSNVRFRGALITRVLQRLGTFSGAKDRLIHALLAESDIASWGVGMTVPEFAREPALLRELHGMLRAGNAGSLSLALAVLKAGQQDVLDDAMTRSFEVLLAPGAVDFQAACWLIRDFGSAAQFDQLVTRIREVQFRDQKLYEELCRNLIWSDNPREQAVIDIMLQDNRMSQSKMTYSEMAQGEVQRIKKAGQ